MKQRPFFRVLAAMLTTACFALPMLQAQAAVLTSRSIIMERDEPSTASNQEIRFTTPSGVTASGQTLAINYSFDFNLSSIGVGDIDLFHGTTTGLEVSATLGAAPGASTWGVTIAGRVITFTAPTASGYITAGNRVVIRIGTNAVGGVNKIVNPGSGGQGPVFVEIDGSFGDTGGFEVPIYPNDFISISATVNTVVPPPTPGGGGGGGTDGTAPVISNVRVINITQNSATVVWDTDESANGRVDYGTSFPFYASTTNHSNFVTSHSLDLSGLSSDTVYNFRVTSADAVGNSAQTGNLTFRTLPPPVPPVITNIRVINITDTSAIVTWQTDIPSTSLVEYGTTIAYGNVQSSPGMTTNHSVPLTGLAPLTLYHFRVYSTEATGLTSISGDNTFTTLGDITPPSNVFGFTATPGNAQNTLSWTNPPEPDFAYVMIRARTDGFPSDPTDGRFVYQGPGNGFVDGGLTNGTTYYYTNFAFDASGNRSSGAFASATPVGPPTPPTPPPPGATTTPPTPPPPGATTTPPTLPGATTTPPIVSPTSTPEVPAGVTINPTFYAAGGTIELEEDATGAVGSMAGAPLLLRVPTAGLGRVPVSGSVVVGNSRYGLIPLSGGEAWGASFVPSNNVERVPVTVILDFEDGTQARAETAVELQALGRILGRDLLSPVLSGIEGAKVTLYEMTLQGWQVWNGGRFGQGNPIMTGPNGYYGFTVRNGLYRVRAEKEGYATQEREFRVTRNVASIDVILPAAVEVPVIGPIVSPILDFIQSPEVQAAANITAPVAVAVALANLALATSIFSILNYLWFLFTQPLLLLGRRKRQRWGIAYNSLSKVPIDLVAVRLIHAKTNLILQTRITDVKGRFSFRVRPGQYRMEAAKTGYVFPSVYLKDQKEDGDMVDVYHGEIINVEEETSIAVNIPLDPLTKEDTPRSVFVKLWLRRLQHFLSAISVFVTAIALAISPSWFLLGLLIVQILTYFLFRRLALPKKPKGWGIVYDDKSRRPLSSVIVRIFDKKFNKLLETQVTDTRGNYGFFAQKNVYFITAEKAGYKKFKSDDIDLTKADTSVVDKHIPIEKEK